jgi:hypothetical protein
VDSTKAVYDKILELRIANAQIIVNYAAFLEENRYFEESFKVSLLSSSPGAFTHDTLIRFTSEALRSSHSLSRSKFGISTCPSSSSAT